MNEKKKKKIIESYNSESYNEIYDRRYKAIQFEKFEPFWQPLDKDPIMLLDYGCGTGLLWDFFNSKIQNKEQSQKTRLICIDISIGMLNIFKDKLNFTKNLPKPHIKDVLFVCCDGEHLPFRSNHFKYIYAFTSLQNLPNLDLGLEEINRVKKDSAIIAISYLKKKKSMELLITKLKKSFIGMQIELQKTHSTEDWVFKIS
ncbi:class I SAM-dependent methyltransferase [Promethearchaeum syntrophicum]|uniref:Class I SAM-dependent methyltransferase n=1 Tax=Promethearchaeum syntrophicum TaxID=2594042 RepID=A0A5B9D6K0_9ARCH|nr:methyltransferase domain-containing protein [Candidatus Prometheoarchaeum syntrophicum]QEE14581.1 ubiquinone/menaquinone biosynthesis methyltransferase [Candidatus Prometheoarchaeum syntrophicum]